MRAISVRVRSLLVFAFLLAACGSSPTGPAAVPAPPTPTGAAAPDAMAPTPFTREELHANLHVGHRLEWNVTAPGHAREVQVMQFLAVDDRGAEIESSTLDETGHRVGDAKRGRATWEELRDHAAFPAASTEVADESVTVLAGTYDCRRYTVKRGATVMRFWFAKKLPGPPVKIVESEGDKAVETRELARVVE